MFGRGSLRSGHAPVGHVSSVRLCKGIRLSCGDPPLPTVRRSWPTHGWLSAPARHFGMPWHRNPHGRYQKAGTRRSVAATRIVGRALFEHLSMFIHPLVFFQLFPETAGSFRAFATSIFVNSRVACCRSAHSVLRRRDRSTRGAYGKSCDPRVPGSDLTGPQTPTTAFWVA